MGLIDAKSPRSSLRKRAIVGRLAARVRSMAMIAAVFAAIVAGFPVNAQTHESTREFFVDFRVGSSRLDPKFSGNAATLDEIVTFLKQIQADTTLSVSKIEFSGTVSPEGSYQINKKLSAGRMAALEKYVRARVDLPDSIIIRTDGYISWEWLAGKVAASDIPYKDEILKVIAEEEVLVGFGAARSIDRRVVRLQKLRSGKAWREIYRRFFQQMRSACVIHTSSKIEPPAVAIAPTEEEPVKEDTVVPAPEPPIVAAADSVPAPAESYWTRHLYLKSNLVGLGLLIPNVAVEVDLSPRWSLTLPIYYSQLNYFTSTIKFRTFSIQPEIRYWLSDSQRFFIGAHFGLSYYNIAVNGDWRYQDRDANTPAIGGGISVGYRVPIGKRNRWKLEFTVGAGAYTLHYDKFHNERNGQLAETIDKTYIGVDNVGITVCYMFNLNRKKR